MEKKNSYTIPLTPAQMEAAAEILRNGNYRMRTVQYAIAAAEGPDCQIAVYKSGKCLVQGKGAYDWITFVLEPEVLGEARLGYEDQLDPKALEPHMGVDESGKGDFFGPLVIAAAYVDADIVRDLRAMDVRDSKAITTDRAARELARKIRERLGEGRYTVVRLGPAAYNRMYGSMGSVNRILAWGHAKCIENLLEKVPGCPRAISDQFGPEHQIKRALQERGRKIVLEQHPRAEADTAVAAASILAREGFLDMMDRLGKTYGRALPKGASPQVKAAARELAEKHGGEGFPGGGEVPLQDDGRRSGGTREDAGRGGAAAGAGAQAVREVQEGGTEGGAAADGYAVLIFSHKEHKGRKGKRVERMKA